MRMPAGMGTGSTGVGDAGVVDGVTAAETGATFAVV
jgi:hypothetical protein